MYLKAGHLVLETALGNVIEQAPLAYQIIKDQKIEIPCKYVLNENVISFKLLKPYNKKYPLIIDPVLIFSTYSGSSAMNWGRQQLMIIPVISMQEVFLLLLVIQPHWVLSNNFLVVAIQICVSLNFLLMEHH